MSVLSQFNLLKAISNRCSPSGSKSVMDILLHAGYSLCFALLRMILVKSRHNCFKKRVNTCAGVWHVYKYYSYSVLFSQFP